jgi:Rieske Fe-S protein
MRESDSMNEQPAAEPTTPGVISRRRAVAGVGAVGLAGFIAACGTDDGGRAEAPESVDDEAPAAADPGEAGEEGDRASGDVLVGTADVPVGGGVILEDAEVVVTQPEDGEYRAFSALCTHERCLVTEVAEGQIRCACHGSRFFIEDGGVENGPAASPLPEVAITVEGDQIVRA